MTISRVELQGTVARAQDFTTIKHNEDNKGMVDQTNFQKQFSQEVNDKLHQVHDSDQTENQMKKFDARDKGNGQYAGDGGQNRKQEKQKQPEGKVVLKKNQGGFDIKI